MARSLAEHPLVRPRPFPPALLPPRIRRPTGDLSPAPFPRRLGTTAPSDPPARSPRSTTARGAPVDVAASMARYRRA